jgi:hypothetical protein
MSHRKPYPSDVRDEEWAFVAFACLLLSRAFALLEIGS